MDTELDPLAAWQRELDELRFTVDLPLLAEPATVRAVSARIERYMRHFAQYRGMVQSVSGYTEVEGNSQLRQAIGAIGHELQSSQSQRTDLKVRMDTLSSLVRLELEREHEFIAMLTEHLDAPQITALSSAIQTGMHSPPHADGSVATRTERGIADDE